MKEVTIQYRAEQDYIGHLSHVLQGVIEGCRAAFILFCSALFETSNKELTCIPQKILSEVSVQKKPKQKV